MANILYVTYDGLTDPLGRSQVLPYLQGCAGIGHRITILSFEKPDRFRTSGDVVSQLCKDAGIEWHHLLYHKQPPIVSTLYDMHKLTRTALALQVERKFDLVHCRSYIPAVAGLKLKRRHGVPLLFDMRGFWPEEKTEGGSWNLQNPLYRWVYTYFKAQESALLRESNHIVSLTEAAKVQLLSRPECEGRTSHISVIPCCVDFDHFPMAEQLRSDARTRLGIEPATRVLGYLGSLGGNYLLKEMLEFFKIYSRHYPSAKFLLVTLEEPKNIRAAAQDCKIDLSRIVISAATREQVPATIAAIDAGIAFKRSSFSALACSPTKLGEMLGMGIPVIANCGVGDVEKVIDETGGGIIVRAFDDQSYDSAIHHLEALNPQPMATSQSARALFGLERGVLAYHSIYSFAA